MGLQGYKSEKTKIQYSKRDMERRRRRNKENNEKIKTISKNLKTNIIIFLKPA
jgi:hypothetical protein